MGSVLVGVEAVGGDAREAVSFFFVFLSSSLLEDGTVLLGEDFCIDVLDSLKISIMEFGRLWDYWLGLPVKPRSWEFRAPKPREEL